MYFLLQVLPAKTKPAQVGRPRGTGAGAGAAQKVVGKVVCSSCARLSACAWASRSWCLARSACAPSAAHRGPVLMNSWYSSSEMTSLSECFVRKTPQGRALIRSSDESPWRRRPVSELHATFRLLNRDILLLVDY